MKGVIYCLTQPDCSVLDDEGHLTIQLFTRYYCHATGEEEITQILIFFLLLVPMRGLRGETPLRSGPAPLYFIPDGETDNTITVL